MALQLSMVLRCMQDILTTSKEPTIQAWSMLMDQACPCMAAMDLSMDNKSALRRKTHRRHQEQSWLKATKMLKTLKRKTLTRIKMVRKSMIKHPQFKVEETEKLTRMSPQERDWSLEATIRRLQSPDQSH